MNIYVNVSQTCELLKKTTFKNAPSFNSVKNKMLCLEKYKNKRLA